MVSIFLYSALTQVTPAVLVDMFCTLNGFSRRTIQDRVPDYGQTYRRVREAHTLLNVLERMTKASSVLCQHCGKEFDNTTPAQRHYFRHHSKKCKLERMNCDCKDITFKNPRDKRRHMLLFHSGKKLFGCSECTAVVPSQQNESAQDYPCEKNMSSLCQNHGII